MKTDIYPINYFKNIWNPIQGFKKRKSLNWLTIVITILFLNSLLAIPTTINFSKIDSLPMESFYPKVSQVIEEAVVDDLKQAEIEDGRLLFEHSFLYENETGVIAGGLQETEKEEVLAEDTYILFEDYQLRLKEDKKPEAELFYTKNFQPSAIHSKEELVNEISHQWFTQNKILLTLIFTLLISVIQLIMLLLIVFGSSFFLYLTKRSVTTSISTYKESVNLVLNLLGLPTLISMIFGLLKYEVTWMMMIQSTGLVFMLLAVYGKTKFLDEEVKI